VNYDDGSQENSNMTQEVLD